MDAKKIVGLIFSIIFIGAFAFVLTWGITNFNKVQEGISGTGLYTEEDLNNAYQDGYDTALTNKDEYDELINGYRDTITTLNDSISQLNSQITNLKTTNQDCQNQITSLTNQKISLEEEIDNLNTNKVDNEKTITNLNNQIANMNFQITNLNNTIQANETTINGLNGQIVSLNTQIAGLNQTITNNENTISSLRININELNDEIVRLSNDKQANQTQIAMLNNEISSLNEQITSLTKINNDYLQSIDSLEKEVATLTKEKDNLILENTNYYNTISSLNNQIVNLQNVNTQLENTNNLHLNTIAGLNAQITNLNQQISDITHQSQNNNSTISSLNAKIKELEESVQYYENYIASLENDEQVAATFEYDGSVYNIQIVNKGSTVAVNNPESTNYIIFNGWKVNDEFIDLSTYTINENTKIVADLTYKYDVNFVVDGVNYNSQIIEKNNYAILPEAPSKTGYEFDGWSADNVNIVNVETTKITSHTTYTAMFTKLHNVTFMYEDTTKSTQIVRNGSMATNVSVENTAYKIFNGWKVNGSIVEISTYKVTSDTTFIADITYRYDVIYKVDETNYNTQIVTANNYPNLPSNPTKEGYEFDGWSLNGVDVINTSTLQITANTTYYAVFTKVYNVSFVYEDTTISLQTIRQNSTAKTPSVESSAYKVFNGWTINGEIVSVNDYSITENTTFVADITYKYDVKFMVDNTEYNNQIVVKNGYATLPTNPSKAGYEFDGWTVNGVDIIDNITDIQVTGNITYIARFTQVHSVSFVYDNKTISTQTIRNSGYALVPELEADEHIIFNGWTVNGSYVDASTYSIITPTTFTADITYRYDVTYLSQGEVFASEIVTSGEYATLTAEPRKDSHYFEGWTIDGENVIELAGYPINKNTTFIAKFAQQIAGLYTTDNELQMSWNELVENNYVQVSSDGVVSNGSNIATFRTMPGKLVISNEVTSIYSSGSSSSGFLYNCTNLYSVTIPESITSVGAYAFYGCTHLTEINFNAEQCADNTIRDYAFAKAGTLEDGLTINFGNTCKYIPTGLFVPYYERTTYNPNITTINIGENVEGIGRYVFYEISTITTVNYNAKNCADLDENNYSFMLTGHDNGITLNIGDSVERVPAHLFTWSSMSDNGAMIKNISMGRNVKAVGDNAFGMYSGPSLDNLYFYDLEQWLNIDFENLSYCNPMNQAKNVYLNGEILTEVVIPETITKIGRYAFYGCDSLTTVIMHDNITSIGRYAFDSCKGLTTVRLSSGLLEMGDSAFRYNDNLTYNIYDNAKYLGNENNPYVLLAGYTDRLITSCEINPNTKIINSSAFLACTELTSIHIPYSVITIGDSAFQNCNKMTSITFDENSQVNSIASVFYGCSSLQSIIIPANCTELGYMTFYGCEALTSIYIPKNVIKEGTKTFYECANLVIYCEFTEEECQMAEGWNANSSTTNCTTYYGYSLEQYLNANGG